MSVRVGGRVIRLEAPGDLRVIDLPYPKARTNEVAVDIQAVGVCGTDLHAYRGRGQRVPIVLGHDVAAMVAATGPDVDSTLLGKRVTIDPAIRCGDCVYCARNLFALCSNGTYMGMSADGALGRRLVVPSENVHVLPDEVDDLAATVLEPVVVALRLLERTSGLLGEPVRSLVVGGGPLGIVLACVLQAHGHNVCLVEPQPGRRRIAEELRLTAVVPDAVPPAPPGPALLVETSATPGGARLARKSATAGSVLALVGRSSESIPLADVLLKELCVIGVRGGSGRYDQAIRLVADGLVNPAAVITHHYVEDQAATAFSDAVNRPNDVLRAVIHISQ